MVKKRQTFSEIVILMCVIAQVGLMPTQAWAKCCAVTGVDISDGGSCCDGACGNRCTGNICTDGTQCHTGCCANNVCSLPGQCSGSSSSSSSSASSDCRISGCPSNQLCCDGGCFVPGTEPCGCTAWSSSSATSAASSAMSAISAMSASSAMSFSSAASASASNSSRTTGNGCPSAQSCSVNADCQAPGCCPCDQNGNPNPSDPTGMCFNGTCIYSCHGCLNQFVID